MGRDHALPVEFAFEGQSSRLAEEARGISQLSVVVDAPPTVVSQRGARPRRWHGVNGSQQTSSSSAAENPKVSLARGLTKHEAYSADGMRSFSAVPGQ